MVQTRDPAEDVDKAKVREVMDYVPSRKTEDGLDKPVTPVSEYGGVHIFESFAEVFADYVLGRNLDRDQLESFKQMLRTSSMRDRVASRVMLAGLAQEAKRKFDDVLRDQPIDERKAKALAEWLAENFHFQVSRTPKGAKAYKDTLDALHWYLRNGNPAESYRASIEIKWGVLEGKIDEAVRLLSDEGGKKIPKELRVGQNTYENEVGFNEAKLAEYAENLEKVFRELKGWRKKALTGGLKVVLASPKSFGGTAGGKYKSEEDILLVRATPAVLKRTRGTYGAFDYIIVHELGHRFDHKFRPKADWDKFEWQTTQYSSTSGEEAFAELFALTNFGLPVSGKDAVLARFEEFMETGKIPTTEPRELPPHLRKLLERADKPESIVVLSGDRGWQHARMTTRVAARYKEKKKVTNKDGEERTVYVYSERQIALRNAEKARKVEKMKTSIGKLRSKVKKDLRSDDPEKKLTALAVALIDHTYERVGNDTSAEERGHFGVTGWQRGHLSFGKGGVTISYTGKSGVKHKKKVSDTSIKNALRDAYEAVEGEDASIFEWEGGRVTAEKVNAYLEPFDVTAKDLRGFHANRVMAEKLREERKAGGELPSDKKGKTKALKAEFKKALEATAEAVGHEASTLKNQYLVVGLEDQYLKDGSIIDKVASVGADAPSRVVTRYLLGL